MKEKLKVSVSKSWPQTQASFLCSWPLFPFCLSVSTVIHLLLLRNLLISICHPNPICFSYPTLSNPSLNFLASLACQYTADRTWAFSKFTLLCLIAIKMKTKIKKSILSSWHYHKIGWPKMPCPFSRPFLPWGTQGWLFCRWDVKYFSFQLCLQDLHLHLSPSLVTSCATQEKQPLVFCDTFPFLFFESWIWIVAFPPVWCPVACSPSCIPMLPLISHRLSFCLEWNLSTDYLSPAPV